MVEECERSGLPKAWCSHCKGESEPKKKGPRFRRLSDHHPANKYTEAKIAVFDGRCPACDESILAGDEITQSEDGWIHKECE